MNETGGFHRFQIDGKTICGKAFMDYADQVVRQAYYAQADDPMKQQCQDFVWYLWCGRYSPLYGRDKMATFERMFVDDQSVWAEHKNPYYDLIDEPEICEKILDEFGLGGQYSHIINGHVPVRAKEGEAPVRGGGKLIMIDGGFCRAYQDQTGLAGYTMFYNSYGIRLAAHQPFSGLSDAIKQNKDILSTYIVYDTAEKRITVSETDTGKQLMDDISDLSALLSAYRKGEIKEKA
jgi:fructose-1,6-bisphosphatase-3